MFQASRFNFFRKDLNEYVRNASQPEVNRNWAKELKVYDHIGPLSTTKVTCLTLVALAGIGAITLYCGAKFHLFHLPQNKFFEFMQKPIALYGGMASAGAGVVSLAILSIKEWRDRSHIKYYLVPEKVYAARSGPSVLFKGIQSKTYEMKENKAYQWAEEDSKKAEDIVIESGPLTLRRTRPAFDPKTAPTILVLQRLKNPADLQGGYDREMHIFKTDDEADTFIKKAENDYAAKLEKAAKNDQNEESFH